MISQHVDLKPFNTFGISVISDQFSVFESLNELKEILNEKAKEVPFMVIGGGSNVLFTQNFKGLILQNKIKGVDIIKEDGDEVFIKSGAGENWHNFVLKTIDLDLCGIENLSLIPGSVGASPMQNIGAYGREIKDVFHSLEAYHIDSQEVHTFYHKDCEFGYRESVFKRKLKGQYIILSVTYRLSRVHKLNTSYGAIEAQLKEMKVSTPTLRDVSNAVIAIRSSKLPNPKEIGNAGSFFKNPVVGIETLEQIQKVYPDVPNYPAHDSQVKLAAGWLIEKAGWKGKTIGNYGVHKLQALVLVNYGGATGKEIFTLSTNIIEDVKNKFNVLLEREVNIV